MDPAVSIHSTLALPVTGGVTLGTGVGEGVIVGVAVGDGDGVGTGVEVAVGRGVGVIVALGGGGLRGSSTSVGTLTNVTATRRCRLCATAAWMVCTSSRRG